MTDTEKRPIDRVTTPRGAVNERNGRMATTHNTEEAAVSLSELSAYNLRCAIEVLIERLPAHSEMWGHWNHRVHVFIIKITSDWVDICCMTVDREDAAHRHALRGYTDFLCNVFDAENFRVELDEDDEAMRTLRVWIDGSDGNEEMGEGGTTLKLIEDDAARYWSWLALALSEEQDCAHGFSDDELDDLHINPCDEGDYFAEVMYFPNSTMERSEFEQMFLPRILSVASGLEMFGLLADVLVHEIDESNSYFLCVAMRVKPEPIEPAVFVPEADEERAGARDRAILDAARRCRRKQLELRSAEKEFDELAERYEEWLDDVTAEGDDANRSHP